MKSAGAPKKQFKDKKIFPRSVYVTYDDDELLKEAAKIRGMSVSTYIAHLAIKDAYEVLNSVRRKAAP